MCVRLCALIGLQKVLPLWHMGANPCECVQSTEVWQWMISPISRNSSSRKVKTISWSVTTMDLDSSLISLVSILQTPSSSTKHSNHTHTHSHTSHTHTLTHTHTHTKLVDARTYTLHEIHTLMPCRPHDLYVKGSVVEQQVLPQGPAEPRTSSLPLDIRRPVSGPFGPVNSAWTSICNR